MAFTFFPNPKPSFVDDLWFKIDQKADADAQLTKEEDDFFKRIQKEISKGKDVVPIGKTKEQHTVAEVDEEEDVDEEESAEEELEDDTDEFDTASAEVGSVDEEVEMADTSGQNTESSDW